MSENERIHWLPRYKTIYRPYTRPLDQDLRQVLGTVNVREFNETTRGYVVDRGTRYLLAAHTSFPPLPPGAVTRLHGSLDKVISLDQASAHRELSVPSVSFSVSQSVEEPSLLESILEESSIVSSETERDQTQRTTGGIKADSVSICELIAELACRTSPLGAPSGTLLDFLTESAAQAPEKVLDAVEYPLRPVDGTVEEIRDELARRGIGTALFQWTPSLIKQLEDAHVDTGAWRRAAAELADQWTFRNADFSFEGTIPEYMRALDVHGFYTPAFRAAAAGLLGEMNYRRVVEEGLVHSDVAAFLAEVAVGGLEASTVLAIEPWVESNEVFRNIIERARKHAIDIWTEEAQLEDECIVTLSNKVQFVVDVVTSETYCVRQLQHRWGDHTVARPLNALGLVPAEESIPPLTNPVSGRKFDTHSLDGVYPAFFADPNDCIARVKQALLGQRQPVLPPTDFRWRPRILGRRRLHRWTAPSPWATVQPHQILALSPSGDPYLLTQRGAPGAYEDLGFLPLAELQAWATDQRFTMFENELALDEASETWYTAEALKSDRVGSHAVVDMEVYLRHQFEYKLQTPQDIQTTVNRVHAADQSIARRNEAWSDDIRSQYEVHIDPAAQIVTERQSGKTYIAQRVMYTGSYRIYDPDDVARARDFALQRRPSLRPDDTDEVISDDASYLFSVHGVSTESSSDSTSSSKKSSFLRAPFFNHEMASRQSSVTVVS